MLLLRLLPFCVALIEGVCFWLQLLHPLAYPWIAALGVLAMPSAVVMIAWRRISLHDAFERMLPSIVLTISLAFALLLVEGRVAIWSLLAIAAGSAYLSLEMLFVMVYHPSRYPVNGLSRINIAYVPVAVWYAASTSSGLLVFLHTRSIWHVVLMTVIGAALFRTTGHTDATAEEKNIWMVLGALIGVHVGLLGILLPVAMSVQGLIAAFLLSATLRIRRYLYHPKPSRMQAWIEGGAAFALFLLTLVTAKWL